MVKPLKLSDVVKELGNVAPGPGCPYVACTFPDFSPCPSPDIGCPLKVKGYDGVDKQPVEVLEFAEDDFELEVVAEEVDCGAHIKVLLKDEDEITGTEVCVKGLIGYIITGQEGGVDIRQKVYIPWGKVNTVVPSADKYVLGVDDEGCLVKYTMTDCEEEEV